MTDPTKSLIGGSIETARLWGGKSPSASRGTCVNMVEAAEHSPRGDIAAAAVRTRKRTDQRQGAVRPIVVVTEALEFPIKVPAIAGFGE